MDNFIKAIVHLNEKVSTIDQEVSEIKKDVEHLKRRPEMLLKEDWMDGQEVMQALHISQRTLQTLRDSGKLTPTRLLKKYYYKASDINSLLEENYIRHHFTKKP